MRRSRTLALALSVLSLACAKRDMVEVPPRVDLREFQTIGIVQFESAAQGDLAALATRGFVAALQQAKPGTHIVELGSARHVDGAGRDGGLDPRAVKKIGARYHVDALVIGELIVKDVRPRADVPKPVKSMSVAADVDAVLMARLFDTATGAARWTRMTDASRTVEQVSVSEEGWRFDAPDPGQAYGVLVDALVSDLAFDFRPSYVHE